MSNQTRSAVSMVMSCQDGDLLLAEYRAAVADFAFALGRLTELAGTATTADYRLLPGTGSGVRGIEREDYFADAMDRAASTSNPSLKHLDACDAGADCRAFAD